MPAYAGRSHDHRCVLQMGSRFLSHKIISQTHKHSEPSLAMGKTNSDIGKKHHETTKGNMVKEHKNSPALE